MNKMKIKIFTLLSLLITFSLTLSSCDSLWDDLNSITVSFDSNSGTGTMEPQEFEADVPQALSENKFTREGYTFAGWATSADATTAEYADKAEFTAKEDITLYAIWSVIPPARFTITYASTYGSKPANKEVDKGYKLTAEDLPDLTETGYNFKGWDKTAGFEIKADVTITATWKKLVTISYSSTYGTKPDNKTVEEGYKLVAEDLKLLPETDTMYCDSWDKTVGTEITADTTITANWETIVYLKKLSDIVSALNTQKNMIEKIVFSMDSYTGAAITIDCSDTAGYFTGVLTDGTVSGQYVLTIYGNGHRIYAPIDCSQLFANYQKLTTIEFNNFYTSKTTNMTGMFAMSNALNSLNVSGFNTAKVTNMTGMFTGYKDTVLNLSNFDTSKVENMKNMFQACTNLTTLNISSFNTSAVTDMSIMFYGCSSLTSLDVSKFVTAKVTNMYQMFANCYGLEELDLSGFDTSEVTNMSSMFYCTDTNKSNLKKIIFSSKFKTDKVTTVKQMFYRCDKLTELDLSSFDTSAVEWTSMGGQGTNIFTNCSSLVTIYATEKFNPANKNLGIFDGCTNLVGGAGTKYSDAEISDPDNYKTAVYARIDGGSSNPGYFTLKQ